MELQDHAQTVQNLKVGQQSGIPLAAGQSLKIETTPGGEEILSFECPPGDPRTVRIIVEIAENGA